eukprot:804121-Pleurochrysis_carterae.AAC.2
MPRRSPKGSRRWTDRCGPRSLSRSAPAVAGPRAPSAQPLSPTAALASRRGVKEASVARRASADLARVRALPLSRVDPLERVQQTLETHRCRRHRRWR